MKDVIIRIGIVFLLSVTLTNCATIFRGAKKNIKGPIEITGSPKGADVYVDGKKVGTTPFNYQPEKRKKSSVEIVKDGYFTYYTIIPRELNVIWTSISVVTGIFPGCGIPIIVDIATGSIFDISTSKIEYNLDKTQTNDLNEKTISFESTEKNDTILKNQIKKDINNIKSDTKENLKSSTIKENLAAINPRDSDGNYGIKETVSDELKSILPLKPTDPTYSVLRIETGSRIHFVKIKTFVFVTTKGGLKIGSAIWDINKDHIVLRKNEQKIYYTQIVKMRIFKARLWFPIVTFPGSLTIPWFATSKVVENKENSKCKRKILDLRVDTYRKSKKAMQYGKQGKMKWCGDSILLSD